MISSRNITTAAAAAANRVSYVVITAARAILLGVETKINTFHAPVLQFPSMFLYKVQV